jgi:predicted transcriptional regulator
LIDKLFDGSTELLFAALLERKDLSADRIEKLKILVNAPGGGPESELGGDRE